MCALYQLFGRGGSPVYDIIKEGDFISFEKILGKYVNPDPLYIGYSCEFSEGADEDGKVKIVELLLKKGADVNHWPRIYSHLAMSINSGYDKLTDLLLSKGINLNHDSMAASIERGNLSLVMMHRMKGIEFCNNIYAERINSLKLACENGSTEVIKYLVENQCHVADHYTAFKSLIIRNDLINAEYLLHNGAKVIYNNEKILDKSPIFFTPLQTKTSIC